MVYVCHNCGLRLWHEPKADVWYHPESWNDGHPSPKMHYMFCSAKPREMPAGTAWVDES